MGIRGTRTVVDRSSPEQLSRISSTPVMSSSLSILLGTSEDDISPDSVHVHVTKLRVRVDYLCEHIRVRSSLFEVNEENPKH